MAFTLLILSGGSPTGGFMIFSGACAKELFLNPLVISAAEPSPRILRALRLLLVGPELVGFIFLWF
jgi:hypothetical protein